ncbi:hypothetical protein DICSQDRAFT_175935 [Dichomitus squalens LYAD-421 SS1]|uniref:Uncharacterized protein n=1 Tax=Dichomitus squalens (strain LYAD-421) TaxID=732165 RepID=R7SGY3_DICSQ|nr:uncharacterized protein DICSQDRAFT_175935 [Dichomitus squalens LYAD-421 SS1]EJF55419.1 hypothetical protein DICSQDRAFT_175935 [Dichomitus squalens LYAD-421 SS1]
MNGTIFLRGQKDDMAPAYRPEDEFIIRLLVHISLSLIVSFPLQQPNPGHSLPHTDLIPPPKADMCNSVVQCRIPRSSCLEAPIRYPNPSGKTAFAN